MEQREWEKYKEQIVAIIELVEDKNFPARRNITDYLEEIFGYPKEMAVFVEEQYKKIENNELLSNQH